MFTKLYSEIRTTLDSKYLYGFGERRTENFLLKSGQYTTWNYDHADFQGEGMHGQQYGNHPTWLYRDSAGKRVGC